MAIKYEAIDYSFAFFLSITTDYTKIQIFNIHASVFLDLVSNQILCFIDIFYCHYKYLTQRSSKEIFFLRKDLTFNVFLSRAICCICIKILSNVCCLIKKINTWNFRFELFHFAIRSTLLTTVCLLFLCCFFLWRCKPRFDAKLFGHSEQENGLAPVCVRMCSNNAVFEEGLFLHR